MTTGAAAVGMVALVETALQPRFSPTHIAMLFLPEFGGAVATAIVFEMLFRTRFVPVFAFPGAMLVAGAGAVLASAAHGPQALVYVGAGLLGLGVGSSVSPALFITGFSLASAQVQRVFALVELLRGVAAFLAAPLLLHLAMTVAPSPATGTTIAVWVCLGLAAGGALFAAYVLALSRARLQRPDLERWEQGEEPAWESPPLAAGTRPERLSEPRLS